MNFWGNVWGRVSKVSGAREQWFGVLLVLFHICKQQSINFRCHPMFDICSLKVRLTLISQKMSLSGHDFLISWGVRSRTCGVLESCYLGVWQYCSGLLLLTNNSCLAPCVRENGLRTFTKNSCPLEPIFSLRDHDFFVKVRSPFSNMRGAEELLFGGLTVLW